MNNDHAHTHMPSFLDMNVLYYILYYISHHIVYNTTIQFLDVEGLHSMNNGQSRCISGEPVRHHDVHSGVPELWWDRDVPPRGTDEPDRPRVRRVHVPAHQPGHLPRLHPLLHHQGDPEDHQAEEGLLQGGYGGCSGPQVASWASHRWVACSNPLTGMYHH